MRRGGSGVWFSMVGALALSLSTRSAQAQEPADFSDHQRILHHHVDRILTQRAIDEGFGIGGLVFGTIATGVTLATAEGATPAKATWVAGFGALDALAIGSAFLPRDDRSRILKSTIYAAPFVFMMGLAVTDEDEVGLPRLTTGSLAAGYGMTALLQAIDELGVRTRYSTLRGDYQRLEAGPMSDAELATVHRHVLGMRGPIPAWLRGLPLLAGGIVALSPAFDEPNTDDARLGAGLLGGMAAVSGGLLMLGDRVTSYERDVKSAGITVEAAGAGLRLRGWFSAL